jgi:branched-chain amino acid transport system permease protein
MTAPSTARPAKAAAPAATPSAGAPSTGTPSAGRRRERIDRGIKARAGDVFALLSWREMAYLAAPRVIPVLLILGAPLLLSPYWQRVLLAVAVFALLAISWDILAQTGMVSLGQSLFFGMGAYLAGTLDHYLGAPLWVTIPVATVGGGVLSTALLYPLMRLRGIYFAMVTLIFPLMFVRIIEATRVFGGTEGLSGLTPLPSALELYPLLLVLLGVYFGFRRLMASDYGLVLKAIRDNDRAVISAGINIHLYKAQALLLASMVGAFAGAWMTHIYLFVGMPVFALDYSILPIAAAVVGGSGSFAGAMLGAFILVPLSEVLRGIGGLRIVLYGVFLVVFTVALPEGLFPYLQRKYTQFERDAEGGGT